jgi:serine/threonine protein kinase
LPARFLREARAATALNHPTSCHHDVASVDGHDFIVMEYLDGETLEQRLRRGRLPIPELFDIAIAIADAMLTAHREGIIHRDLKPSNVMLTRCGPKLLDFGIAKQREMLRDGSTPELIEATATATIEGRLVGTVPYGAGAARGRQVDARTDILPSVPCSSRWSLGAAPLTQRRQLAMAAIRRATAPAVRRAT